VTLDARAPRLRSRPRPLAIALRFAARQVGKSTLAMNKILSTLWTVVLAGCSAFGIRSGYEHR